MFQHIDGGVDAHELKSVLCYKDRFQATGDMNSGQTITQSDDTERRSHSSSDAPLNNDTIADLFTLIVGVRNEIIAQLNGIFYQNNCEIKELKKEINKPKKEIHGKDNIIENEHIQAVGDKHDAHTEDIKVLEVPPSDARAAGDSELTDSDETDLKQITSTNKYTDTTVKEKPLSPLLNERVSYAAKVKKNPRRRLF